MYDFSKTIPHMTAGGRPKMREEQVFDDVTGMPVLLQNGEMKTRFVPVTLGYAAANSLLSRKRDETISAENAIKFHDLASKVINGGAVDLDAKDRVTILARIHLFCDTETYAFAASVLNK